MYNKPNKLFVCLFLKLSILAERIEELHYVSYDYSPTSFDNPISLRQLMQNWAQLILNEQKKCEEGLVNIRYAINFFYNALWVSGFEVLQLNKLLQSMSIYHRFTLSLQEGNMYESCWR